VLVFFWLEKLWEPLLLPRNKKTEQSDNTLCRFVCRGIMRKHGLNTKAIAQFREKLVFPSHDTLLQRSHHYSAASFTWNEYGSMCFHEQNHLKICIHFGLIWPIQSKVILTEPN